MFVFLSKASLESSTLSRTDCTGMGRQKAVGKTGKSPFNHINKLVSRHDITIHKSLLC